MTKQEKLIVSAYTGILMVDFSDFHEYVERVLDRPVYTHELVSETMVDEIRNKVKKEFLDLCDDQETENYGKGE